MPQLSKNTLETMRHSAAHLLAAAVQKLYPGTKFAIGPSIEDGFYYDFEFKKPITEKHLGKIEKEMEEIRDEKLLITNYKLQIGGALGKTKDQPYKQELIRELEAEGNKEVSFYKLGEFEDLCAGPHVKNTSEIGFFKLLSLAGAYWRGSEKNKMLTRIYGTVWPTQKELKNYLWQKEEAEKRDHKKIGQELELFLFHETAPGMPYWLPKGLIIIQELLNFWRVYHQKAGYQEISSPLINEKSLWEKSGHWKYFKDEMFVIPVDKNTTFAVKPMNCPNAMVVFAAKTRSYKDLPLRLSDAGILHRFERSGTLNGLFRVMKIQQDDAHIFLSEDQVENEYERIFKIIDDFYSVFGLKYRLRLGTRPEKFMGERSVWDKAEQTLKSILKKGKREYFISEGDGVFYGPKVDILIEDAIGREWQTGTIQLDFQLPESFNLKYAAKDGLNKTPVVVHRVIYGSLERFLGILIEHFAGAFPVWLAPVQAIVLPVSDKQEKYANGVYKKLQEEGLRAELDIRSETLQAKIRDAQIAKIPYMVIVGEKEKKAGKVSLRLRSGEDLGTFSGESFIKRVKGAIDTKTLNL